MEAEEVDLNEELQNLEVEVEALEADLKEVGIELLSVHSRKSVRWSAVPVPCLSRLCLK